MFRLGFDVARFFADGDLPHVEAVPAAAQVDLTAAEPSGFALRFAVDAGAGRAYIDYAAGNTAARPPPSAAEAGMISISGTSAPATVPLYATGRSARRAPPANPARG